LISFPITGTLVDFDLWDDIKTLEDIPILLTSGEYDVVRPVIANALYKALQRIIGKGLISRLGTCFHF